MKTSGSTESFSSLRCADAGAPNSKKVKKQVPFTLNMLQYLFKAVQQTVI